MDKIIFTKYSNERAKQFNICTEIRQDINGKRYVVKRPATAEAQDHVDKIYMWHEKLKEKFEGTKLGVNRCEQFDDGVKLEFLQGKTLEEELDQLLQKENILEMIELIKDYFSLIQKANETKTFQMTEEFAEVFGEVYLPSGLMCGEVTNIDMIFANVIDASGWQIIDYEWTFEFPIPINFVLYRALFFYMLKEERSKLREFNLYELFNISKEEQQAYAKMEYNFGRYVVQNYVPVRDICTAINNKKVSAKNIIEDYEQKRLANSAQVFKDCGKGFLEENSYFVKPVILNNGRKKITVLVQKDTRTLRIDPFGKQCILQIHSAFFERHSECDVNFTTNGSVWGRNVFAFFTDDPQILISEINDVPDVLHMEYSVYPCTEDLLRSVKGIMVEQKNLEEQKKELQEKNSNQQREIEILRGQVNEEHNHMLTMQHERNLTKIAYDSLLQSKSVRITKPVRALGNFLRKSRLLRMGVRYTRYLKNGGVSEVNRQVKFARIRKKYPYAARRLGVLSDIEQIYLEKLQHHTGKVKFSILVPLYNTPENFLREMIESVQMQTYENWELCLGDGSDGEHRDVERICKEYSKKDKRIVYKKLEKNYGISGNTNECIKMSTGDYIALFDHDDFLHPSALYENAKMIEEYHADYLYTDEATFQIELNNIVTYHFKPDYAPDNLRANNYICHFSVFSRKLLDKAGWYNSDYDGSQDHDLILRLTDKAKCIKHISGILYFWRSHPGSVSENIGSKTYAIDAGKRAVHDSIARHGMECTVESTWMCPTIYRIIYEIKDQPLITIVIPNKNHLQDIKRCVESILEKTTYENYEIIIVDNGSDEEELFAYYEEIEKNINITVLHWDEPFNYSKLNNFGVEHAKGEYVVLLNNDTEIITENWLQEMLMYAQREDVGAVGAKLYYDDDTIQHAGIIIGMGTDRIAAHCHHRLAKMELGYMGRLHYAQNMSAVTAACLMVKKKKYLQVGGLTEEFVVAYNDVDFCLKLRKEGYLNVFTPFAELYHYESKTRGAEDTPEKQQRFQGEVELFRKKWKDVLEAGDPYFNKELDLDNPYFKRKEE